MKTTLKLNILTATAMLILGSQLSWSYVINNESNMSQVELKSCSAEKEKCVVLKAQKSKGATMKHLDVFVKPHLTVLHKMKTTEDKDVRNAYIDYENQKLVLIEDRKGKLIERAFNLETLAESRYEIR